MGFVDYQYELTSACFTLEVTNMTEKETIEGRSRRNLNKYKQWQFGSDFFLKKTKKEKRFCWEESHYLKNNKCYLK